MNFIQDIYTKLINRGINKEHSFSEKEAIRYNNSSILISLFPGLVFILILYFFDLTLSFYLYTLTLTHFIFYYIFNKYIPIEKGTFFTSCFITIVNITCLTYYGFSYGFQYLVIISIIISIANLRNKTYRNTYYILSFSLISISAIILLLFGNNVTPLDATYTNSLNYFFIFACLYLSLQHSESFFNIFKNLEEERHKKMNALQQKNEEIRSFNHSVAHDLKDPLRTIAGFSTMLYRNTDPSKKEQSKKYEEFISKGVKRVNDLLDDLLVYIETTDKKIMDKHVNLNVSLEHATENLTQKINEHQAQLICSTLPVIKANPHYCTLLFQNFISNSIKFVDKDVQPVITIKSQPVPEGVVVQISDNGIGIPKERQDEIFGAFKKIHSKDTYEGSGLGLSLCLRIVQFWDGKIDVESQIGKGTTFKIFIPQKAIAS